ncbi:MAG: alanine dehydrogenase [Chloroflexota bacterium]
MIVGVPREVKISESRVSTTPAGVAEYVAHGHSVIVETLAGAGSGFSDEQYRRAGATIADAAADVYGAAEMIVKVKEPVAQEYDLLRPGQILFTYLHLAADEPLTRALMRNGVISVAYETVQLPNGSLPLLTPMSEVAGRMSVQVGAYYLQATNGGSGVVLGGVPGVLPARVVVIGGGVVGANAAQIALGMGANVTIVDKAVDRLRTLDLQLHGRLQTLASNRENVAEAVGEANLVIGGVLLPGAKAPKLVTEPMVRSMRPGSVVVDVAIDQGGCIETSRPTSHAEPTFKVDEVVHYCVTNMPGAVPRTSTLALSNATLPYGIDLADHGFAGAVRRNPALARGVNVLDGKITYPAVAEAFGLPCTPLENLVSQA